jgi:hypothetical protein
MPEDRQRFLFTADLRKYDVFTANHLEKLQLDTGGYPIRWCSARIESQQGCIDQCLADIKTRYDELVADAETMRTAAQLAREHLAGGASPGVWPTLPSHRRLTAWPTLPGQSGEFRNLIVSCQGDAGWRARMVQLSLGNDRLRDLLEKADAAQMEVLGVSAAGEGGSGSHAQAGDTAARNTGAST